VGRPVKLALKRQDMFNSCLIFSGFSAISNLYLIFHQNLIPIGTPHVVAVIGEKPARGLVVAAPSAFARLITATGTFSKTETPNIDLFKRISAEIGDEILGVPGTLPSAATKT
jgi:hypothetical protein